MADDKAAAAASQEQPANNAPVADAPAKAEQPAEVQPAEQPAADANKAADAAQAEQPKKSGFTSLLSSIVSKVGINVSGNKNEKKENEQKQQEPEDTYDPFAPNMELYYGKKRVDDDFDLDEWNQMGRQGDGDEEKDQKANIPLHMMEEEEEEQPEEEKEQAGEEGEQTKTKAQKNILLDEDGEPREIVQQASPIDEQKKEMKRKFKLEQNQDIMNILRTNFGDMIDRVAVARGRYAVVTGKSRGPWSLFYMDMGTDFSYYENVSHFYIIYDIPNVPNGYRFHNIFMSPIGTHIILSFENTQNPTEAVNYYINTMYDEIENRKRFAQASKDKKKLDEKYKRGKCIKELTSIKVKIRSVAWHPKLYNISENFEPYKKALADYVEFTTDRAKALGKSDADKQNLDNVKCYLNAKTFLVGTETSKIFSVKAKISPNALKLEGKKGKQLVTADLDKYNAEFSDSAVEHVDCKQMMIHLLKILNEKDDRSTIPIYGLEVARSKRNHVVCVAATPYALLFFHSAEMVTKKLDFAKFFDAYRFSDEIQSQVPKFIKSDTTILDANKNCEFHLLRNTSVVSTKVEDSERNDDDEALLLNGDKTSADKNDDDKDDDDDDDNAGDAKRDMNEPTAFVWTTGEKIYHGDFFSRDPEATTNVKNVSQWKNDIAESELAETRIGVAVSDFHIYVLYKEAGLHVIMQPPELKGTNDRENTLLSNIVYRNNEDAGYFRGCCKDHYTNKNSKLQDIIMYTNNSIFYIERDTYRQPPERFGIWKLYLEQALNPMMEELRSEYFGKAWELCENREDQYNVKSALGDYHYSRGELRKAANTYADTKRPFEEIVARLLEKDPDDVQNGLKIYVRKMLNKLNALAKGSSDDSSSFEPQRICLCTWLLQLYVAKINYYTNIINKRYNIYCTPAARAEQEATKNNAINMRKIARKALRSFLFKNHKLLSKTDSTRNMTYSILESNGYMTDALFFACIIDDFEKVVCHLITNGKYSEAYTILKKFCTDLNYKDKYEPLWKKYSPIIIAHLPMRRQGERVIRDDLIDDFTRNADLLSPNSLIACLLKYLYTPPDKYMVASSRRLGMSSNNTRPSLSIMDGMGIQDVQRLANESLGSASAAAQLLGAAESSSKDIDPAAYEKVCKYLLWCIERKIANENVYNLYVMLLSMGPQERLHSFITRDSDDFVTYNKEYALRTCLENRKIKSAIELYSALGLYENAVHAALTISEQTAKEVVKNKVEDKELKRRLFLKIIEHLVRGMKSEAQAYEEWSLGANPGMTRVIDYARKKALQYLDKEFSESIKLKDVLQFFPQETILLNYHHAITGALENYKDESESLRAGMVESTNDAATIREEQKNLKFEKQIFENDACDYCMLPVLQREFCVFPCEHVFHMDCLKTIVLDNLDKLAKLYDYQEQVKRFCRTRQKNIRDLDNDIREKKKRIESLNLKEAHKVAIELREQERLLMDYLASACPLDGIDEETIALKKKTEASRLYQAQEDSLSACTTSLEMIRFSLAQDDDLLKSKK